MKVSLPSIEIDDRARLAINHIRGDRGLADRETIREEISIAISEHIEQIIALWDESLPTREELSAMLGIDLPERESFNQERADIERADTLRKTWDDLDQKHGGGEG